jgi:MFS family permease
LSLSLMVIGLDLTVLSVALPVLVTDLKATTTQLQWIMDSYILVLAALLLPAGSLGDRIGRKRVLVTGLGLFLAGSLLCAYAWSAGSLIGFRAFMGLGGAIVMPQAVSRLLPRIGTKAAMAAGFTLLAASLALFSTATVDTGYGFVALCLTLMGAGLGTAMTPGLDAIMGAMPAGEFGAGSAVASTFRQVGAAIGVALLGDIYLNRYVARLHLPTALPAPVAHIARQSVGAANAVAAKLPAPLAGQVRGQAHAAFMSGLDWTLLLAAGVALLAAGLVAALLPGRKPAAQPLQPALPEDGRDHPGPA